MIHVNNIPGLGTRSFPDGTSPDAIKAAIQSEMNYGQQEPGFGAGALIGFGSGLNRASQGLEQAGVGIGEQLGTQPQGASNAYAQGVQNERQQFDKGLNVPGQDPVASRFFGGVVPQAIGQALPFVGLAPESIPAAAATGALIGGAGPLEPNQSRAINAGVGGAVGAGGQVAGNAIGGLLGKGVNALRGTSIAPEDQALLDASAQHNVPIFAHQFPDATNANATAAYIRRGPFGLNEAEVNQGNAIGASAQDFTQQLQNEMNAGQYGGARGLDALQSAANGDFGPARQGRASALLDQINQDPDWSTIIKNSQDVTRFGRQLKADQMASKMGELAGDNPVPLTNFQNTLNDVNEQIGSQLQPDDPLKKSLDAITQKINPQQIVDPATGAISTQTTPMNFNQVRGLRTYLQQQVRQGLTGTNALIGDKETRLLQQLSSGADQDLNTFAQNQGGDLASQMKSFNNYYKNNLGPYKNAQLASALNKLNPDDTYKAFITNGNFQQNPQQFYNLLDDKGRAAVRYGMVNDAYQKALNPDSGDFSAPKFINALNAKQGARNVFFQGNNQQQLDGFTNLINAVKGSSSAGGVPATGAMNVPLAAAAGLAGAGAHFAGTPGAIGALGAAFASGNGLRWLLTNPKGVQILRAASKLDPNSNGMDALLTRAGNLIQTATTQQGANRASQ